MTSQILAHTEHAMPMPDPPRLTLDDLAPLGGSSDLSAQLNLAIANQERAVIGLPPQPRLPAQDPLVADIRLLAMCSVRPISPRVLSRARTAELQDRLDELVESYGLQAVVRGVRLIQAANQDVTR